MAFGVRGRRVCLGAYVNSACRYHACAIVGGRRGANARIETLEMTSSNENVLHVSVWKTRCSYGLCTQKRTRCVGIFSCEWKLQHSWVVTHMH
jgi:hypothetical protein